jgi:hypothetical protein
MNPKKKIALLMSLVGTTGAYAGIATSHTEAPKTEAVTPEVSAKPVSLTGVAQRMPEIIRTPVFN